MSKRLPIESGQTFNRLTAVGFERRNEHGQLLWKFKCACGNDHVATTTSVIRGRTKSCGCQKIDSATKHGLFLGGHGRKDETLSPEMKKVYRAWRMMKSRCSDVNIRAFKDYGGRGITVCARWNNDFMAFLEDVGMPPDSSYSIGRKNNDGNYEPDNCHWETRAEQQRNRRNSLMVTIGGETLCAADWADKIGIEYAAFYCRVKAGWTGEKLLIPLRTYP